MGGGAIVQDMKLPVPLPEAYEFLLKKGTDARFLSYHRNLSKAERSVL